MLIPPYLEDGVVPSSKPVHMWRGVKRPEWSVKWSKQPLCRVVHEAAVDQEGVHAFTQLQWNKGGPKRITTHLWRSLMEIVPRQ